MSMLPTKQPTYTDGRTKQSFKDETDINKILKRAQKTGTISHLNKFEARYGDFSDFDFFDAQLKLSEGRTIFDALPSEIRSEFNQSAAQFFKYVNDPANIDRLEKLLPGLAAPGKQNIVVDTVKTADEIKAAEEAEIKRPEAEPPEPPKEAEKAPEEPSSAST